MTKRIDLARKLVGSNVVTPSGNVYRLTRVCETRKGPAFEIRRIKNGKYFGPCRFADVGLKGYKLTVREENEPRTW